MYKVKLYLNWIRPLAKLRRNMLRLPIAIWIMQIANMHWMKGYKDRQGKRERKRESRRAWDISLECTERDM